MKKIIINEQDFQRILQDTEIPEEEPVEEPVEDIPPSESGMKVVDELIYAINRFYSSLAFKNGIPGKNARLYEKYKLNDLKRELLKIRHSK